MECEEDRKLPEQAVALLKILEIGAAQIKQGQVKPMDEVFEELDCLL